MPVLQLPAAPTNRQQRRAKARRGPVLMQRTASPRIGASTPPVLPATQLTPEQAVLLDLYGQTPVAFHRVFVDLTASVTAALWLSHAVALVQQRTGQEGAFLLSQEDCHQATGLSRREQESARARLREIGFLTEQRRGRLVEHRIDMELLAQRLLSHSAGAWSLSARNVATGSGA
ncbi:MAG: hypothetical protein JF606_18415 [Burkholderiales bacterium]|nr:hypothetical protein [Burkholderiales bacterium]